MVQRVLCLPGYGQNAAILDVKLASLKKACKGEVEFVTLDPLFILHPRGPDDTLTHDPHSSRIPGDALSIFGPSTRRRGWGIPLDDGMMKFARMEESVVWLGRYLARETREGRTFDGLLGFSLGACIGGVITGLLEDATLFPEFLVDGKQPHPPFKFTVLISGCNVFFDQLEQVLLNPIQTPSLHVLGKTDVVVGWKRTIKFMEHFENKLVEWHVSGHHIPSRPEWTAFFNEFITSFADDHHTTSTDSSSIHSPPSLIRSHSLSYSSDSSSSSSSSSSSPQNSAPVSLPSPSIRIASRSNVTESNVEVNVYDGSSRQAKRWRVVSFRLPKSSKSPENSDGNGTSAMTQAITLQLDQLEESLSHRSSRGDVNDDHLEQPEAANLLGLCAA